MKKWSERTAVEKILTVVIILAIVALVAIARAETPAEKMFDDGKRVHCLVMTKDKAYEIVGRDFIEVGAAVAEKEKSITSAEFICDTGDGKIHVVKWEQRNFK